MFGGAAGFWGSWIVGSRIGKTHHVPNKISNVEEAKLENRHTDEQKAEAEEYKVLKNLLSTQEDEFRPHNQGYIVLGTLILFAGWLFFNGGKTLSMFHGRSNDAAKIMQNTFISAAFSGLVAIVVKPWAMGYCCRPFSTFDARTLCNGIITGLVAICGACNRCEPWAAVIIGVLAGLFYTIGCKKVQKMNIDDPCESTAVYMYGGMWGLLAVAFLDNLQGVVYPSHEETGRGKFFGYQICGIVVILVWATLMFVPFFMIMKKLGLLRVNRVVEIVGLDFASNSQNMTQEEFKKVQEQLDWKSIPQDLVNDVYNQTCM